MNRGFAYYFGRAFKTSLTTIWKNRNVFKSVAYLYMDLAALLTVVFRPMFNMAGVTQAKAAQKTGEFYVSPAFSEACKPKPFWTMAMSCVIEGLIMLGGLVLCAVIVGALALLATAIATASQATAGTQNLLLWLFMAPGLVLTALFVCVMAIIFSPTAYVVESNPGITAAETVAICFNTMKPNGKLIVFLTTLITMSIELAVIAVCAGVTFAIYAFMPAGAVKLFVICIWLLIAAALVSLTMPTCILTKNLALKDLFEDIAQDPVNASKRTAGIRITNVTGAEYEYATINDQLVDLFDETEDDNIPIPARKAKKKARDEMEKEMEEAAKHTREENAAKPPIDKNVDEVPEGAVPVDEVPTQDAPVGVNYVQDAPAAPQPIPAVDPQAVASLIDDAPAAPEAQPAAEPAAQPATEPAAEPPKADPFASAGANPFGNQTPPNPFANAGTAPNATPFGGAGATPNANPFGDAGATPNATPFGGAGATPNANPFDNAGATPNATPFDNAAATPDAGAAATPAAGAADDTAGLTPFEIRARERARRMAQRAAARGGANGANEGKSEE